MECLTSGNQEPGHYAFCWWFGVCVMGGILGNKLIMYLYLLVSEEESLLLCLFLLN